MERMYSVDEVRKMLGVSESCIRRWVAEGSISYLKVGRAVRFTKKAIQERVPGFEVPEEA